MIKLKFDYTDIKKIRELLNLTQEEVAFRVPISKSYLSMIESGKRGLSMENYKRILEVMNTPLNVFAEYNISDIVPEKNNENISFNRTVLNTLISFLERNKKEWCIDGIIAFNNLLRLYLGNEDRIFISNMDYPLYNDGEDVSHDYLGKILIFDKVAFENIVLDDNFEKHMSYSWSIPTIEGIFVDLYLLDSHVTFDNGVPIKESFSYITNTDKQSLLDNTTINQGLVGTLEKIDILDKDKKYLLSFAINNKIYKQYYNSNEIEVIITND